MAINISGTTITFNDATTQTTAAVPGGDYIMVAYTSPATWTKPAGLKAVNVTVIGAGGNGGNTPSAAYGSGGGNGGGGGGAIRYLDAPAVPGPISVTVGTAPSKTSSFGPLVSATGGTNGATAGPAPVEATAAGGAGSSGTINVSGGTGFGRAANGTEGVYDTGFSGAGAFAFGGFSIRGPFSGAGTVNGTAGQLYGGGGTGSSKGGVAGSATGGAGGSGIVIVEEFY